MTERAAKTNGVNSDGGGEKLLQDPEDPEYQKQKMRPADIDQDMKEMDRRKRVDMILNSNIFREELERIIEAQIREGYSPASLLALQQISELMLPSNRFNGGSVVRGSIIPIADIRGVDSFAYAKGEKLLRCKLASVYRLIDMFGWSEGIYNHITCRVSQDQEHFLINPFGLMYHEITASTLVKVDMQGNLVEQGTTNFGINVAGFNLHSAIHAARPDIRAVVHLHVPAAIAVASCRQGLMPLSHEAVMLGEISTHEYQGIVIDPAERESLARDLGPVNKVMLLQNHGFVCCGETLEEAFFNACLAVRASEIQVKLMSVGLDHMITISDEMARKSYAIAMRGAGGVNSKQEGETKEKDAKKWKVGELEFEAYMRMLDNAGYRTGYIYKQPLQRSEAPKPRSDVEIPPAASSSTYIFDEDDLLRFSPFKRILDSRKAQDKTRWLNSPNVYQKVEVLETGTTDPKKITKWVAEGSPTHGTSVRIDSTHHFIPPGTDPQEFKRKQKELKEVRMQSKVSAGPQSHILEGVSWDEVKKLQDANMSGTGDQVVVVGAASKGIIQREFQHNAMVYKTPYAKNPFDSVTDEELEEYKRIVEKKQRGEPIEDEQQERYLMTEAKLENAQREYRSPGHSPTSPFSEDEDYRKGIMQQQTPESGNLQRSYSDRRAKAADEADRRDARLPRRYFSTRDPKMKGEAAVNGEDKMALRSAESGDNVSAASRSSKEGSPTKEAPGTSPKKEEKKKKKGIKTPSFLKKKKDKKKEEVAK